MIYRTNAGFENALWTVAAQHGLSTQMRVSDYWLEIGRTAHRRSGEPVDLSALQTYLRLANTPSSAERRLAAKRACTA